MSASLLGGEFEAEIALPFRVEYRIDAQGAVEVVAIVPLCEAVPAEDVHLHSCHS